MRAHPIGLTGNVEHDGPVQKAVQHGGGHHRVVIEDLGPRTDLEVGRETDAPLQVALRDHLEECRGGLTGQCAYSGEGVSISPE